jgi:hypothetical protein
LKIQARATLAVQAFRAGQTFVTLEDSMDVLPGIVSGPMVISNAMFPVVSDHCVLTGTFSLSSNESTPPTQPQEDVDDMVNTYLQNLKSELTEMEKQRSGSNWADNSMQHDHLLPNAIPPDQMFFPPTNGLLPAAPPLLTESQSIPAFDSALWTGFMAQFGGGFT